MRIQHWKFLANRLVRKSRTCCEIPGRDWNCVFQETLRLVAWLKQSPGSACWTRREFEGNMCLCLSCALAGLGIGCGFFDSDSCKSLFVSSPQCSLATEPFMKFKWSSGYCKSQTSVISQREAAQPWEKWMGLILEELSTCGGEVSAYKAGMVRCCAELQGNAVPCLQEWRGIWAINHIVAHKEAISISVSAGSATWKRKCDWYEKKCLRF